MEKHYDSDWAKAKSRDLVGRMLDETILTFRKPNKVRVLHFGGIDMAEAKQVYLPRGILPENIVSIERERKISEEQRKLNTGVQVVNTTLEDYLIGQKAIEFDLVSLDFIGPINSDILKDLEKITRTNNRDRFILHCANLMARDKHSSECYILGYSRNATEKPEIDEDILNGAIPHRLKDNFQRFRNAKRILISDDNKNKLRDNSHTMILYRAFSGSSVRVLDSIFRFFSGDDYDKNLEDLTKDSDAIFNGEITVNREHPSKSTNSQLFMDLLAHHTDKALEKLCQKYKIKPELRGSIWKIVYEASSSNKTYIPSDASPYSYISESGAPMIGNVIYLVHPRKMINSALDAARLMGFPINFKFDNQSKTFDAVNHWIEHWNNYHGVSGVEAKASPIYKEREFLGNSSKPVLTKKKFIQELEAGRGIEEIQTQYRGWGTKPLSQWKSHFTMGTYHSKYMVEHNGGDSNIEKLSKEDALDFLASGIPSEEIHSAWPTSFSIGQLRALKSHQKRGTYEVTK